MGLWPSVLAFFSFIVWRLLTSESDVKSHQKVQIWCFTSPSIRGISEKQSFLVYFQLGIISLKKNKKQKQYWSYVDVMLIITLSILATCLVSSNCSVTHVRWGEGTSSVLFQWRPAFSALWRCGNSVVSVHHINNFWNTRSNLTTFSGQSPQWLRMVCAKLHVKRLRIDWDINEKRSAGVVTTLAQCFALITFEVLNQTPPNLLGSCRSSSRWYLPNYIKNGWELTSELTSKWIYIYWNTQANFTLISLITFEVLAQTLQNSQGSGHNTIRWCLQNYMEDGWELTSELTSK